VIVESGVGPELLRTVSCGAAVSARFLVMLEGVVGGQPLDAGWRREVLSVCLREGGRGRDAGPVEEVARAGEAGGVWVDARGRVLELECLGSSRASRSSEWPVVECRCRFLRKLRPRRPDNGRLVDEWEAMDSAVAATVGAAGAGAVYITAAAR
jgi:hypothetical protein